MVETVLVLSKEADRSQTPHKTYFCTGNFLLEGQLLFLKRDKLIGNHFCDIPFVAFLIVIRSCNKFSFDKHLAAFGEDALHILGHFPPCDDVMPLSVLDFFALVVFVVIISSDDERSFLRSAVEVFVFDIFSKVSDKLY